MLSRLAFLIAVIIFAVLCLATVSNPFKWETAGFAFVSLGLLLDWTGPGPWFRGP